MTTLLALRSRAWMAAIALLLVFGGPSRAAAQSWPQYYARWALDIFKIEGEEPTDQHWLHLMAPGQTVTIGVKMTERANVAPADLQAAGIEVKYTVHGVPVSGWLPAPFVFTLSIDNPALDGLPDGVHDVSLDVRGLTANRMDFRPRPVYLHLARGRAMSKLVPIISRDTQYADYGTEFGPGVVYVDPDKRRMVGYPLDPSVTPWHQAPYLEDLYLEEMAPHSNLFYGVQMWWEQANPPHAGAKFVRAMVPKWDESHPGLRTAWKHDRFPFRDGPRGVGWMSPYTTGQVDSRGGFAFVETGGPLRYLRPDGEIITVAGWRVKPDKEPIYVAKPLSVIRRNMEFRGQWVNGQYTDDPGFRTPLDVAIDPRNENIWYVAAYEDHCIWKVEIANMAAGLATVSVFAGDPGHSAGFADGTGVAARLNGPTSLVFDPVCDCIYVADQDNDAIRKITRGGAVSTVVGRPGMASRLSARGVTDIYNQQANRAASVFEVTAEQAAAGVRPDIYKPFTVRVDSRGNLIMLELGTGSIRRINPLTGETKRMWDTWQKFGPYERGWAWLDVDRWGNSGPRDGIYYGVFTSSGIEGEPDRHPNEVYGWIPPGGGSARWLFAGDWDPFPDGWGKINETDAPHYPWLVAVDPRGGVLIAGSGEHGVSRLRVRRSADPVPTNYFEYLAGEDIWMTGGASGVSFAFKFGWGAHNYLGYADAWAHANSSAAALIEAFEIPPAVQNDPNQLALLLNFIRLNTGVGVSGPLPGAPTNVRIVR